MRGRWLAIVAIVLAGVATASAYFAVERGGVLRDQERRNQEYLARAQEQVDRARGRRDPAEELQYLQLADMHARAAVSGAEIAAGYRQARDRFVAGSAAAGLGAIGLGAVVLIRRRRRRGA